MSSFHNVYKEIDPSSEIKKASYILQILWRDITSIYDITGPYYTSECGLDHRFIMACVSETMHLFSIYGFDVILLICDVRLLVSPYIFLCRSNYARLYYVRMELSDLCTAEYVS